MYLCVSVLDCVRLCHTWAKMCYSFLSFFLFILSFTSICIKILILFVSECYCSTWLTGIVYILTSTRLQNHTHAHIHRHNHISRLLTHRSHWKCNMSVTIQYNTNTSTPVELNIERGAPVLYVLIYPTHKHTFGSNLNLFSAIRCSHAMWNKCVSSFFSLPLLRCASPFQIG